MNTSPIRLTDTNSSNDSSGRTWGLDGSLFWIVTGGAAASVGLVLFLFSGMQWDFLPSLAAAAIPSLVTLVYVFGFRQGKPPGYDVDCLDTLLFGRGFAPDSKPFRLSGS
jgi:hypothetical protein